MPHSKGRHCRRCHIRIQRRKRLCPVCGALNLKVVDYALFAMVALAYLVWAWTGQFGGQVPSINSSLWR